MPKRATHNPRDLVAEILRRTANPHGQPRYVIRLSNPPTSAERLQLLSARLERRPIVVMPARCATIEEWLRRYSPLAAEARTSAR